MLKIYLIYCLINFVVLYVVTISYHGKVYKGQSILQVNQLIHMIIISLIPLVNIITLTYIIVDYYKLFKN